MVLEHEAKLSATGRIAARRTQGDLQWLDELVSMGLAGIFQAQPGVAQRMPALRQEVREGRVTPLAASRELLGYFRPPKQ
jgi:LAO/AO transport system kinase